MKTEKKKPAEIADILSMVSIAAVALLLILLFKVKGGFLGVVLGTVAVAALIYWFKEIKKTFKEEIAYPTEEAEWFYDITDEGESVTLIAKVPGPPEKVKVRLVNEKLEIEGGANFMRRIQVPKAAQLQHKSYINGVLHVKLQKTEMPNNKMPPK